MKLSPASQTAAAIASVDESIVRTADLVGCTFREFNTVRIEIDIFHAQLVSVYDEESQTVRVHQLRVPLVRPVLLWNIRVPAHFHPEKSICRKNEFATRVIPFEKTERSKKKGK